MRRLRSLLLAAAVLLAIPVAALAYLEYTTSGGVPVGAMVTMWLNGSSQPQAVSAAQPMPIAVQAQDAVGANSGSASITSAAVQFTLTPAQTAGYSRISFNFIVCAGGCSLVVEGSWDNSNWYSQSIQIWSNTNTYTTISGSGQFFSTLDAPYVRVRSSAYTSGTGTLQYSLRSAAASSSQPVFFGATNKVIVYPQPQTTSLITYTRVQSANTTNSTNIKGSAAGLYVLDLGNNGASDAWFKVYAKATAPTCGTDTPIASIYLPKGTHQAVNMTAVGLSIGTGLGYCITGAAGDADTTAVAAGQVTGFVGYF